MPIKKTMATADTPLDDFKAAVRSVALEVHAERAGTFTEDRLNQLLRAVGLKEKQKPVLVPVEVTTTRVTHVLVDDQDSPEAAVAAVAAMDAKALQAKATGPLGTVVSHRTLTAEEATAADPLAAVKVGTSRTAQRTARQEVEAAGNSCPTYTAGLVCSRGAGHVGQHVAMAGSEVLRTWTT